MLAAQKHQDALACQTGDNLVLVLKLRQAEDAARGALAECEALKRRQEPWFDQVCIVQDPPASEWTAPMLRAEGGLQGVLLPQRAHAEPCMPFIHSCRRVLHAGRA